MKALKANKFRVGDEVERVVDGNNEIPIGSIWTVSKVDGTYIYLDEFGEGTEWFPHKFKLVQDQTQVYNPLVAQEGGGHYKNRGIQPLEYTMQNNLSFCEGNVVKYISRYKSKNGIEDLAKVIHYALLASYEEYGEKGSTELRNKVLKLLGVSE